MATVIGVISDTHGWLRPEAVEALRGSQLILHAGDIGQPEVLAGLQKIAPVEAVRGNVDLEAWASKLPLTRVVEVEQVRLFLLHDISKLRTAPAARGYAAVVFGHSHRPESERRNGVLYFNPGSAGPRRFRLPISLGRLIVDAAEVTPVLLDLPQ